MTANITIRPATPADLAAVQTIVADAYGMYVERIGKKPGPMLDDYAARIGNGEAHVAEAKARIAGVLVLIEQDDALLLDNVAVAKDAQGMGVGAALIAFAESEAARRGFARIRLYTHIQMTENLTLYPHLGYRETRRITEAGYDRVYFEKTV